MRLARHVLYSAAFSLFCATAAYATPVTFTATLNGPSESPANASPGTGFATVLFDPVANTMRVEVTFAGLLGTTTASHIHCCTATPFAGTAGVATTTPTFAGFPLGVISGSYDAIFDMTQASSYNAAFITAQGSIANAEVALFSNMFTGNEYLNVHSSFAPGGEIRGFLTFVPEPDTSYLFAAGLLGSLLFLRQRRRRIA
jgi:hypothetical protein